MCRALSRLPLAAIMALAIAGCGPRAEEAVDVAVIGSGRPVLADPSAGPLGAPGEVLLQNVAQGLVRFDAHGQIEPGLAERWNVSDDGLSYIFRIAATDWPDGRTVNASDVAKILNRQLRAASRNPLKDTLGAVTEILAMTDRVIEIRLGAPRPNLLELLAQPQFAIVRQGQGTGPFQPEAKSKGPDEVSLVRTVRTLDNEDRTEQVALHSAEATKAVADFKAGKTRLVLGGSFADLPSVPRRERPMRAALRFDPVAGLFGLVPGRSSGPLSDKQVRDLLNRAINRDALIAALDVPDLVPRTTVLQAGLEGNAVPAAPGWAAVPIVERYTQAVREGRAAIGDGEALKVSIALPAGPGSDILFNRLAADWRPIGVELVRAGKGQTADLKLIDQVAPSSSPAWFVRSFRCGVMPVCSKDADTLMESARASPIALQRTALLAEAGRLLDEEVLFMPIAAPVRWSLVADELPGFVENIVARHPLWSLRDKPGRERQ
jgi:oligopeptide transport system substrate-binding protein